VINYVYDGLNPVQEKNGATVTANLLTGLGIDEFFTRTDGVGVRSLLPDALGSTVALGDGTGTLQTQYTYEPFGFVSQTGAASTSSYKYTGREDDGSGLYYYRARYYQPRFQRFIAEDQIGFRGGINFYGYALNNPVNWVDPTGLETRIVIGNDPFLGVNLGHVGLSVDNGIDGGPMIYDPSGSYLVGTRGSGGVLSGPDANWPDYLRYQMQGNTKVDVFVFPTTPEEERKIAQRTDILGDPRGINCARNVSQAIQGIGPFKDIIPTILPGRLRSQLQQLQRK
jgi:RHS repeat-associated protein